MKATRTSARLGKLRAAIETLESRQLLTVNLIEVAPTPHTETVAGKSMLRWSNNAPAVTVAQCPERMDEFSGQWIRLDTLPGSATTFDDSTIDPAFDPEYRIAFFSPPSRELDPEQNQQYIYYSNILSAYGSQRDEIHELSATLTDATHVTLSWRPEIDFPNIQGQSISLYRKLRYDPVWPATALATLPSDAYSYPDTIETGQSYEYMIRTTTNGYGRRYGYVSVGSGVSACSQQSRGTALMVVERGLLTTLASELATFRQDLEGDGWVVTTLSTLNPATGTIDPGVERDNDSTIDRPHVAEIRDAIKAEYDAGQQTNPGLPYKQVRAVILIGHVPVPYSGTKAWDGHNYDPNDPNAKSHQGAWVADAYYGDMTGSWVDTSAVNITQAGRNLRHPTNSNIENDQKFDDDYIPDPSGNQTGAGEHLVEIPVGRIDMAHLETYGLEDTNSHAPLFNQQFASGTELALLKRYLAKDHAFRQGMVTVPRRAFAESTGSNGDKDGWRNLVPLVGRSQFFEGRWKTELKSGDYLFAYISGGGDVTKVIDHMESRDYADVDGATSAPVKYRAVFNELGGSWFGDWNEEGNLLRSAIASDGLALTAMWNLAPSVFYHPMGLGEPIATSLLLTQNNLTLYGDPAEPSLNSTHVSLLGDPTLRAHVVKPAANLQLSDTPVQEGSATVPLEWDASPDAAGSNPNFIGYRVYRRDTPGTPGASGGPFVYLGSVSPHPRIYLDTSAQFDKCYTYMVRAEKREITPSGSYYNLSQGTFFNIATGDGQFLPPGDDGFGAGGGFSSMMGGGAGENPFVAPPGTVRIFDELSDIWDGDLADLPGASESGLGESGSGSGGYTAAQNLNFDFNFLDRKQHEVQLDFSNLAESVTQTIEIYDPHTGQVLASRDFGSSDGATLTMRLRGRIAVRITNKSGGVVSLNGVAVRS